MAIVIKTKKTGIPVTLGELEFVVDTSDDGMNNLAERYQGVAELMDSVGDEDGLEKAKEVLEQGFDSLLGDGSFEQIYEQTPSTILCVGYLTALMEGVAEEMDKQQKESQKNINKKYLTKK